MPEPIPTDQLVNLTTIIDVAVSPGGERLAFIATEYDKAEDEAHTSVFTVPTDGSAPPHRLTRASDASAPAWSPDGTKLGFLATRDDDIDRSVGLDETDEDDDDEDNGGDEEPSNQVWAFDLERGGDAMQLTDREHGVREFDWGPDGERIVISARDPTEDQEEYLERRKDDGPIEIERLQHKADGVGYTDDVTTYLFVVDLESGEERRLDAAYGAGAHEPQRGLQPHWNPNSEEIAFITCLQDRPDNTAISNVFTVNATTGKRSRITDDEYGLMLPRWSPDGHKLTFAGRAASNWYLPANVFVADLDADTVENRTDGLGATVSWFGAPRFVDSETVLAGFGDEGWTRFYRLGLDGADPEPLTAGMHTRQSMRFFDIGGDTVAYTISDPDDGHDIFVSTVDSLESDAADPRRVTDLNRTFIDEHAMPSFTRIETPNDDVTVESMVYYPDTFDPDDPTPHPLILWMHGGPMSYDDPEFSFNFAYFTSRGYIVCKPNYRGSTSYGEAFAEVLRSKWGTVEVDDILAVTDDLVDRGWADGDRLFPMGFSYGGISTGYLVTQSDRFTAAAAEHGIYDIRGDFGTSDSQVWVGQEFGLPWEDPDTFDAASSILDLGGVSTPTLVTAGGQDWRCPPTQSEQFYVGIRKQDVPAKLVIYPNENHNVGKPERAIHRLETIAEWFETHDPTVEPDE